MKSTSDVYFAASLLSLGYVLQSVDRKDPRHMQFVFTGKQDGNLGGLKKEINQENLDNTESQWANRTLQVNAFDYAEAIKRMKSLIHSS